MKTPIVEPVDVGECRILDVGEPVPGSLRVDQFPFVEPVEALNEGVVRQSPLDPTDATMSLSPRRWEYRSDRYCLGSRGRHNIREIDRSIHPHRYVEHLAIPAMRVRAHLGGWLNSHSGFRGPSLTMIPTWATLVRVSPVWRTPRCSLRPAATPRAGRCQFHQSLFTRCSVVSIRGSCDVGDTAEIHMHTGSRLSLVRVESRRNSTSRGPGPASVKTVL